MSDKRSPVTPAITLKDVAKIAGVSTAAVSNALNGTGRMSNETRERIRELAERLKYRPNHRAASLRTGLTKTIGFVMTPDDDPDSRARWSEYSSNMLYTLVVAAEKRGFTITIISANNPDQLMYAQIDLLYYLDPYTDDILISRAKELGIPILMNDNLSNKDISIHVNTGFDEMTRGALAALTSAGCTKPALLTELPGIPSDEVAERVYLEWCTQHHVAPIIQRGNYGRTDIEERVNALFDGGCDGIYSYYEEAATIMKIAAKRGIRIPEDVLLVAATINPAENDALGVCSTLFHPEQIAELSFDTIVEFAKNPQLQPVTVNIPWEFVPQRTCVRKTKA